MVSTMSLTSNTNLNPKWQEVIVACTFKVASLNVLDERSIMFKCKSNGTLGWFYR